METPKLAPTLVTYESTSNVWEARRLLSNLPDVIACDFEAASRWSDDEKKELATTLKTLDSASEQARVIRQQIASDGLSHPTLSRLTHFSVAGTETEGIVLILDNPAITKYLLSWLVSTSRLQVWHNATFDFKFIYHYTGKFPPAYEDTQQWAKALRNHVNVNKALTGLKYLMGYKYGAWAVAADNFNIAAMYDEKVLLYAATDACATLALYHSLQDYVKEPEPCLEIL